jgi:hypothetical protein
MACNNFIKPFYFKEGSNFIKIATKLALKEVKR